MNLENLFGLQKKLDDKIVNQHNIQDMSIVSDKILTLEIEIGELASEVKHSKYLINKSLSNENCIIKKYVRCLHSIISLGLSFNFETDNIYSTPIDSKITEQFLNLYIDITDFIVCSSKDHYITLFEDFLSLGISLDLAEDKIINTYLKKNSINNQKQVSGYY